jgi:hypothetical protein
MKSLRTIAFLSLLVVMGSCKDENVAITGICPVVLSTTPANLASGVDLGTTIVITFNESMNPLTITPETFTLTAEANTVGVAAVIAGVLTYDAPTNSMRFDPTNPLPVNSVFTGRVEPWVKDLMGNALQEPYVWTFTTGVQPVVILVSPLDLAVNVPINTDVTATFNIPMTSSSLNGASFTVMNGVLPVAGIITYTAPTVTFNPTTDLLPGVIYSVMLTSAVRSALGVPLMTPYVWSFTTIAPVAPTVISTNPVNLATGVALNSDVTATFSVAMDVATLTTSSFTLKQGLTTVLGTVSLVGSVATFNPTANLTPGLTYTATVTTSARNTAGTALATDYVWTFEALQAVAPTIVSTDPANLQTGVALNSDVSVLFSQTMDAATLTTSSFTLKRGATTVSGTVNTVGATSTFNPTGNLLSGETYTATITTSVENSQGVALANQYVWTFNTAAPLGPNPVILNSVAAYGIIAGVGVRNDAGFSVIHDMNVGISPGVRSSITGFPPATVVNGAIHASDDLVPSGIAAVLLAAKQHLVEAYLFAEGATFPAPQTADVDQGGLTLAPGIYKASTTLLIQNGDLTLDAQGDANAVWIFQIGSALTTVGGAGGNIILAGGAQAKNVYWQVGSSATIGDNTIFKGNVLALSNITMNSGAVAEGRMLARNGTVVMTSTNTITKP